MIKMTVVQREMMIRKLRHKLNEEQELMRVHKESFDRAREDIKAGRIEDLSEYLRQFKDT